MLRGKLTIVVWLSLLLLVACAGAETPQPTNTPTAIASEALVTEAGASATPDSAAEIGDAPAESEANNGEPAEDDAVESESAIATPGRPETVSTIAPDGLHLLGTFYPAAGIGPWPAVLLLHMLGSNREAWTETGLPAALTEAGYAVLALDMRGHGDTGGTRDWALTEEDLPKVWRYLAGRGDIDPARIAIVGASIGANMAMRTAAREALIPAVILLSPGLDYQGVTTEDVLAGYGARPLLIVASSEDSYAADSSRTLAEQAGESAQILMYDGAGHGTNMFRAQPDLIDTILDWLGQHL